MRRRAVDRPTIPSATDEIFDVYLSNASSGHFYEGGQNFYFDGWDGLGASAVLAAVAKLAKSHQKPPGFDFDIVIHVDCSVWESRRAMQRRIAEELELDGSSTIMKLFDDKDEDDDFSGVDKRDRAEIEGVGNHIYNMTKGRRLLVIFQNGSDHEIDLARFGLPMFHSGNKLLWTFRGRFRLDPAIGEKVISPHYFLYAPHDTIFRSDIDRLKLVHEEASQLGHDVCPELIANCWFYWYILYFDHGNLIDYYEDAHAANCWVCDGIIPAAGDSSWQIGKRIHQAMQLDYLRTKQIKGGLFYSLPSNVLQEKASVWVSVTPKDVKNKNIQTVPKETTSYFLTLEKSDHLTVLPKNLFHQSCKLRVLRLSCCAFSFASPPFICCHNLRFVLVDGCRAYEDSEFIGGTHEEQVKEWEFLKSLWVLDIRDTNWDWILSPSKMLLMTELRELNLKAARASSCAWDMAKLQLKWLCNLHRLRVIDSSTFLMALAQDSFMGMQKLELLDLSGNSDMQVLPNISAASRLRALIVDGCARLQQVESGSIPKSLEFFSFDGFGRASRWKNVMHMPEKQVRPTVRANQETPQVSKISLEGCEELKNMFLRGLPNLNELNLSDTAIKALDLEAIQVVQIECLFLLGCRNLRRLKWSNGGHPRVNLLCIDYRGKEERGPIDDCCQYYSCSQVQQEASQQMVHIVIKDAKFLWAFTRGVFGKIYGIIESNQYFHMHLASSGGQREVIGNKGRVTIQGAAEYSYIDVLNKLVKPDDNGKACNHHLPLGRHIEIAKGGWNWDTEEIMERIEQMMAKAESFHMHDHPSVTTGNPETPIYFKQFPNIRWCCIQRCPKLHTVFLVDQYPIDLVSFQKMETLCVSDLLAVHCISCLSKSRVYTLALMP